MRHSATLAVLLFLWPLPNVLAQAEKRPDFADLEKRLAAAEANLQALDTRLASLDKREQSWTEHGWRQADEARAALDRLGLWITLCILGFSGVFCAVWAQNTGRNPWIWFACGFLVHALTLAVLLYKNGQEAAGHHRAPALPAEKAGNG